MTCDAIIQIVRNGASADGQPHTDNPSHPGRSGHALPMLSGQREDGAKSIIQRRCKRQTFRSNEARKRYLAVHTAMARLTCSEGE